MPLRNGEHGYGAVTKVLHWLTVAALATQFAVGLTMDADAAAERAEDAADARADEAKDAADAAEDAAGSEAEEEAAEEAAEAEADRLSDTDYLVGLGDGINLLDLHVVLGASILLLGVVRMLWRRVGGLPPWADALSLRERTVASWTERALLACLFLVPGSGLTLLLTQDDALVPVHVAAQLLLVAALAAHLGLVLRHTLLRRDRLLGRMLPGADEARRRTSSADPAVDDG